MIQSDALDYSTLASVWQCKGLGQLVARMALTRQGIQAWLFQSSISALPSTLDRVAIVIYVLVPGTRPNGERSQSDDSRFGAAPFASDTAGNLLS